MTTTHPRESLYCIEDTLQQIQESRAAAEAEGDSEALKVIDQIEREYLTKEAAKVTSYVALIRSREDQAEACDREIERIAYLKKAALNDVARLKANALAAMQQFGVKELKATPGGGLRRQGNGGLQALEIADHILADEWKNVTVTLPMDVWINMAMLARERWPATKSSARVEMAWEQRSQNADTKRIREALRQRIPCPECKGVRQQLYYQPHEGQEDEQYFADCRRCKGEGTIPQTIPGVKLLERGEHIRVI